MKQQQPPQLSPQVAVPPPGKHKAQSPNKSASTKKLPKDPLAQKASSMVVPNSKLAPKSKPQAEQKEQVGGVSARAYGVYTEQLEPLVVANEQDRREIASLTKMMTMLAALRISEKFSIQIKTAYLRISANASSTMGTAAELDPKEWATVEDLLYGLMLPSGNDAAVALAENFGAMLVYEKKGEMKLLTDIKSLDITGDTYELKNYTQHFVKYMNTLAGEFGMKATVFMNPHGLDCKQAYSTVADLAKLIRSVLLHPVALKVMSARNYFARLKVSIGKKEMSYREADWMNTHKLMWRNGYIAGKTGKTIGAGGCLATIYQKSGKKYFVVVLGCKGDQERFRETEALVEQHIVRQQ